MKNIPKEREIWLVICNDSEKEVRRKVVIYKHDKKEDLLEVLLCDSNLDLATSTSAIFDNNDSGLNYPIATHFDLLATLFQQDNRFVKKIGQISKEGHEFLKVMVGDINPTNEMRSFQRGLPVIYRSDNRWINKENSSKETEILTARVEDCIVHTIGWENAELYPEEIGDFVEGFIDMDLDNLIFSNGVYKLKKSAQTYSTVKYSMKVAS